MTPKKLHPGLPDGELLPQPDRSRGAVRERPDQELRGDALDGGGALLCGRGPAHLPGLGLLWGRSGHFPVSITHSLIGPDHSRYCALIGLEYDVADTSSLIP